jgi:4-diphosphocytidyl-2-C-methyl-D-erythritol kinase
MPLELASPCKINLVLNTLGRRPDGFHELETVMQPVNICDELVFEEATSGLEFDCDDPRLPADEGNLVVRAARAFFAAAPVSAGVRIQLRKRIPLAAGLGGGSGNAATTLVGLNRLFGEPLGLDQLGSLAARLGSDVPFFLEARPALATGRGERVAPLEPFAALRGLWLFLIHPGFGIPTAWAYGELARFPAALNGRRGRAAELVARLQAGDLLGAAASLYNALEAPALRKYPVLALYQEFCRTQGALATLMSGSGSTTFAWVEGADAARRLRDRFVARFGDRGWMATVPLVEF